LINVLKQNEKKNIILNSWSGNN